MTAIANTAPVQNSSPLRPWKLISGDRNTVAYRPIFAKLTGSVTAAILLQQILFRWDINHEEPFYKFRDTPEKEHPKYTPGDSWCEELAFSKGEFDTALNKIGTKITRGQSKRTESDYKLPNRDEWKDNDAGYSEALSIALKHLIIYWTDGSHVTWYQFNSDLMDQFLNELYSDNAKSEILIYLDKYRNRIYLDKARNRTYLSSESTRDNQRINTTAKSPDGVSRGSDSAITPDSTMKLFNEAAKPALAIVQEKPESIPFLALPPIAPQLPPTPPKAVEASPMPQDSIKAVLAPDLPIQLDAWYVDAPGGVFGPYPSYEAVKRGADEHHGRVTQGQAIKDKQVIPVDKKATKPKAERKPDPVFDAIALGSFGLAKVVGKVGGRIAGLVKEVALCTADELLPALAADLTAMYDWRKKTYPQLSAPTQGLTICKYLAEYRQSGQAQTAEAPLQKHYFPDGTYELRAANG